MSVVRVAWLAVSLVVPLACGAGSGDESDADPISTGPEASTEQGNGSSPELDDSPDEAAATADDTEVNQGTEVAATPDDTEEGADNAEPSALEEPESTSDSESADAEDPADDGDDDLDDPDADLEDSNDTNSSEPTPAEEPESDEAGQANPAECDDLAATDIDVLTNTGEMFHASPGGHAQNGGAQIQYWWSHTTAVRRGFVLSADYDLDAGLPQELVFTVELRDTDISTGAFLGSEAAETQSGTVTLEVVGSERACGTVQVEATVNDVEYSFAGSFNVVYVPPDPEPQEG